MKRPPHAAPAEDGLMAMLPETPRGFWDDFAPVFTRPAFRRFLTLLGSAVLTVGRRTIANLLRTAGSLADGASSSYRRVFSRARWSPSRLAEVLARRVAALYRDPADDRRARRRHQTPARQAIRLIRLMLRWFPGRRFVFVGDSAYGTHETARFADRNRGRLTPASKIHPEADLLEPPSPYGGLGRPRVKGARLPKPREAVAEGTRRRRMTVAWYGGGTRRVETTTGAGRWNKKGVGLVPVRWAFVHDRDGAHRDEYFYATDPTFDVRRIVETYTGRWSIETTSQETRSELHVQTTRGWSRPTVLRATPCLFGLYSVVAMLYAALPERRRVGGVSWPGKSAVTFSDAISAVRLWIWAEGVFAHAPEGPSIRKLPPPIREILYAALAPAA